MTRWMLRLVVLASCLPCLVVEAQGVEAEEPPTEDADPASPEATDGAGEQPIAASAPVDDVTAPAPTEVEPTDETGGEGEPTSEMGDALRQREAVRPWHVAFGTMTGLATYATTVMGYLTFHDRYGWDGDEASSGCGSGAPIFGMEACSGAPIGHLVAAVSASTAFAVTFTLALFMPDPLGVSEGGGLRATLLAIHKSLRWALLVLFAGQLVLGSVLSNVDIDDFGTQRDLGIAHLVLGTATMATMTTQGIVGSIMEW